MIRWGLARIRRMDESREVGRTTLESRTSAQRCRITPFESIVPLQPSPLVFITQSSHLLTICRFRFPAGRSWTACRHSQEFHALDLPIFTTAVAQARRRHQCPAHCSTGPQLKSNGAIPSTHWFDWAPTCSHRMNDGRPPSFPNDCPTATRGVRRRIETLAAVQLQKSRYLYLTCLKG